MSKSRVDWPFTAQHAWASFVSAVCGAFLFYILFIKDGYNAHPFVGFAGTTLMIVFASATLEFVAHFVWMWGNPYPSIPIERFDSRSVQESIELTGR